VKLLLETKFWSDLIFFLFLAWLGHQGAKTENTKSAMTPELMAGSSPNFYQVHLVRIHDIIPGFFIWPTFQGHRGQSSYGNVSRAHFVTTGAIDLILPAYVPLGEIILEMKFRSDLILGLATRGQSQKVLLLLNWWLDHIKIFVIGISSKDTWHNTRVFDLTYFSRSHRSKFVWVHFVAPRIETLYISNYAVWSAVFGV
jgi:hypothetical protein